MTQPVKAFAQMSLENQKLLAVKSVNAPETSLPANKNGHVRDIGAYKLMYAESIADPDKFFGDQARGLLDWIVPFDKTVYSSPNFTDSPAWFLNGQLNAAVNCVDRHAFATPNKQALIYEADSPDDGFALTYAELLVQVCQLAQLLQSLGVKKGDVVTIYLPMTPVAVVSILAVVRLGAVHSCVFAGFSPGALKDRILDSGSQVVITCDQSLRAGKAIEAKQIVDKALESCPDVHSVVVVERTGKGSFVEGRDVKYSTAEKFQGYSPAEPVNSEHPLFLLYTSGSTGKPKGMQHSTAGYLLGAAMTTKHVFGVSPEDIMFTAGDVGWITGHTYAVYGPLLNGATSVIFESTPIHPTHTRYWDIVDKHKVTQFYVAPTALRLLRKYGTDDIQKYDLSSLRTLGSVGEPIAEEIWDWYYKNIGRERCTICDTYWLTESGSILGSSLPGVTPMKPGSTGFPFFGIKPAIIDPETGKEIIERPATGALAISQPWPSMARTVWGDYGRYKDTYLKPFPGHFFTGDGASMDTEGYIFVSGRMDDVVNVSGHRLSTAEIEASFLDGKIDERPMIVESAVVGVEDELTGQSIAAFVVLESWLRKEIASGARQVTDMAKAAILVIRQDIGPFAAPKKVIVVDDIPKTRSGKIMRRVLRKIISGETDQLGELSTLSNPSVIDHIIDAVKKQSS